MAAKNITGQIHNGIKAIRPARQNERGMWLWIFRCPCGREFEAKPAHIWTGATLTCGCRYNRTPKAQYRVENIKTPDDSSVLLAFYSMRSRCSDVNHPRYHQYGGRGITICPSWSRFETFRDDMGPKPSPEHSLDRIDNNGNYCPQNCRWATAKEQAQNRH